MRKNKTFDHKKLGREMWFYAYPPTKLPEIKGFEDGLPETCLEKIEILLKRCKELKKQRDERIAQIKKLNKPESIEEIWLKTWASVDYAEYYVIQKWLTYWTGLWRLASNKPLPKKIRKSLNWVSQEDIERARQASIEPYFEGRLRNVGGKLMGLCPFHEERTPSFCIFPDGDYHCFGCQSHGDAITYLMKIKGMSFPDAVRALL